MKRTLCSIIAITALLLLCCQSLKIRKPDSIKETTNQNESQVSCPPGYQCFIKETTKSSKTSLEIFNIKGSKNYNKLHGDMINYLDDSIDGYWNLVINTQNQYGFGVAQLFDHDLELDLIAEPVYSHYMQPMYRAAGIDEHLQIIAIFYFYFSHDVEVTGFVFLDDKNSKPVFKLEFDPQSLMGDLYLDGYPLTRVSIGKLEMKFDEVDKYQGTIKLLKDGPFQDVLCLLKFEYQYQYGPGIDQFIVTTQCAQSQEDSDQSYGETEGSKVDRGLQTNPKSQYRQISKIYDKLLLKKNASTTPDKKKQVLKMVKISENYEKLVYGLRIDLE